MLLHNNQTERSKTIPTLEDYSKNKGSKNPHQGGWGFKELYKDYLVN